MRKNLFPGKLLSAVLLCATLAAAVLPLEAAPQNSSCDWDLAAPANIPQGPQNAAVIYKPVHEVVYASCPLYVRSGPGPQYAFLGKLSKGEVVRRGAIGNNGWSQILYGDREAYVSTIHLSVSPILPDDPSALEGAVYESRSDTVRAICVTKLRNGPGSQYAVIGHLTQGSGAPRLAVGDNGWSQLLFHDTVAYACTADLSSLEDTVNSQWEPASQTLYATAGTAVFAGPGHDSRVLGYLSQGVPVTASLTSRSGWTEITYEGRKAYAATAYLTEDGDLKLPRVETSLAELPTPNAPFLYQYMAPEGIMPHALFTPAGADLSQPLPLIISLHGALEIGEAPETLKHNFITREFLNWEYTGLQGFDAYIVCPQLTGYGYAPTWRDPKSADRLFELIDYLVKSYHIDPHKIILEGHSLGGEGVFYMAADPRACFSALVPISAYDPYVDLTKIHASIRGYTGSPYLPPPREDWDSFHFMKNIFEEQFGISNFHMKNCSHYDIPMVAFEEDLDRDGASDLISWMLAQ